MAEVRAAAPRASHKAPTEPRSPLRARRRRSRGGRRGPSGQDLHLQVKAAVMRVDDRIGKAGADRQIGTREALLDQPARADLAARLLVIGDVQFDRAVEPRAAFLDGQHGEGVSGDIRLRHRRPAPDHPAVDDRRAVRIVRPPRPGRHHVAMRIERDRRAPLPETAPHDQVGRRDHAVGLDEVLGNLEPLDLKAKSFQERGDDFCGAVAIPGRIVRRNLHDLGQEAGLGFGCSRTKSWIALSTGVIASSPFRPARTRSPRRASRHRPASHARAGLRARSHSRGRYGGW